MLVATSMTAGRFDSIAFASADEISFGFPTRMPSAPISSAIFAKLTCSRERLLVSPP